MVRVLSSSAAQVLVGSIIAVRLVAASNVLSLLQLKAEALDASAHEDRSCSDLANHGSYFSVKLEAGTPPQEFDVVADTGSDAVIIPSCICREAGECTHEDRCFTGTGNSSTFFMPRKHEVPLMDMEFGSGSIKAAVGTDVVRIGSASANMKEGLLLMVDRHLDIVGPFEGILGLGQLQSEYTAGLSGTGTGSAGWDRPKPNASEDAEEHQGMKYTIPGFLREAGIDRFSLCFNDGESPGVLRLGTKQEPDGVPSVGTLHWGLEMHGLSVGSAAPEKVLFCGGSGAEAVECGAIPDSGTTVILGPDEQVRELFKGICDQWPRCKKAARTEFKNRPKEEVFQLVLARCEDWLKEGAGLEELPSIHMHLGNAEKNRTLELSAWAYIFESLVDDLEPHSQLLGDLGVSFASVWGMRERRAEQYACAPAFGTSDYSSSDRGPVWIVGTPLFYEYVVGYDRSTLPPEVTFSADPCGECGNLGSKVPRDEVMVLAEAREERGYQRRSREVSRSPRKIRSPPRVGHHWRHKRRHVAL